MVRELKIGDKFTFSDWGLVLTSKEIPLPEPRFEFLEVPYRDGEIDISDALRGEPTYGNRECTFSFDLIAPRHEWERRKREIASYIHGRKLTIIEPDDPTYHYIGRLSITDWRQDRNILHVEFEAICEPYKLKNVDTVKNINIPIAPNYAVVNCHNERKRVIPTITVSQNVLLEFEGRQMNLSAGTYQSAQIMLSEGFNELKFYTVHANTDITIRYREGAF